MKTQYLSKPERDKGTAHYLKFSALNAIGFPLMGGTIISLLAIHFEANNLQLGYLSSIMQISGLILLFVPPLLAGKNVITVQSSAWLLRGLICLPYGFLLLSSGRHTSLVLIMLVYTSYCLIRTIGVAMATPVQQMLTTPATIGDLVVRSSMWAQFAQIAALFTSFLVLSFKQIPEQFGLLTLIGLGILMNTLATYQLRQIPCREVVEYQPGRNIFVILRESFRNRERTFTLLVNWQTLGMSIAFSFVVPFLRKTMLFPANIVFMYTIIASSATILVNYALKPFVDRIGSKPLLLMASFLLISLSAIWGLISPESHWGVIFVLGFVTAFFSHLNALLVTRLVLKSMPTKDKIGYTSMINFFSAIISLFVGLLAGWLADVGKEVMIPGLNSFGFTFLLTTVMALINGILCSFLNDPGSLSVKDTVSLFFSTRNLKAFIDIYQLNLTEDPKKRKAILLSIEQSSTDIATDEIRRIIKNPLAPEKGDILKSLFENPRPALVDDLLQEAQDQDSYHRNSAIFALGAYPEKQVEDTLIHLLDDPSMRISSTAAKSLAHIGNRHCLEKIQELAANHWNDLWAIMNYYIAISLMDREGKYLQDLFGTLTESRGPSFRQSLFALAAKMLNCEPDLSTLYQEENITPNAGLKLLLDDAKQLQPFLERSRWIQEQYAQSQYQPLWEWCQDLLGSKSLGGPLFFLRQSIDGYDFNSITKENTFAVLYFTAQMLK